MTEIDKEAFISAVVHDLRAPLNACVMSLSLLELKASQPAEVLKSVEVIRRNLDRQALLIEDLADAMEIVAGGLALDLEDADLVELAEQAAEAAAAGVEVGWAGARPNMPRVAADPERLVRAIGALLEVVASGGPAGERIELAAAQVNGCVRVEMRRAGAAEVDPAAGDAGSLRPGASRSAVRGNAALRRKRAIMRLTVASEIIEKHGGQVELEEDDRAALVLPVR